MGLLDLLLGRREDPTAKWPAAGGCPTPAVDLSNMTIGPLRFGSELKAAQCLGKPDNFRWTGEHSCELLYAFGGFLTGFENGRLDYVAFFIGPDDLAPKHTALKLSEPQILGGVKLTAQTGAAELRQLFGKAEAEDVDDDETVLTYERAGTVMEFELSTKGQLKRWNLYPRKTGTAR